MTKLLGNLKHGLLFVISAPAGSGKTTLAELLVREFPCVVQSISCTTRPPRPGEVDGQHYHFITQKEFNKKIAEGAFLEYAQVFGNYYGTTKEHVESLRSSGKHVILVIDTQGAEQIRHNEPAITIFISPPSFEELKKRLNLRQTDSEAQIEERLKLAEYEMDQSLKYDYHIVNDNLDVAYDTLKSIFVAEEHRNLVGN